MERVPIKPPIVVTEGGDTDVFESIRDAELYLEPIDVGDGKLVAYDSEGRLLRLIPSEPRITIECEEWEPQHAHEVHETLMEFLRSVGLPEEQLTGKSLHELVSASLKYKTK
jgi:hypothetical protein